MLEDEIANGQNPFFQAQSPQGSILSKASAKNVRSVFFPLYSNGSVIFTRKEAFQSLLALWTVTFLPIAHRDKPGLNLLARFLRAHLRFCECGNMAVSDPETLFVLSLRE